MRRRKHKNDHNHSKNGYIAGNPRYSRKGKKMESLPEPPNPELEEMKELWEDVRALYRYIHANEKN